MRDTSTCTAWRCAAVSEGMVAKCPACGAKTIGSRRIRILGWVLVALGLFLALFMGAIAYSLYPTLARPGADIGGSRWTGTADQARMVLNLFWIIIGFGLLCLAGGAWQAATGRRSRLVMVLTLLGAAAIFLYGWETRETIERDQELEERRIVAPEPLAPAINGGAPAPDKPQ